MEKLLLDLSEYHHRQKNQTIEQWWLFESRKLNVDINFIILDYIKYPKTCLCLNTAFKLFNIRDYYRGDI